MLGQLPKPEEKITFERLSLAVATITLPFLFFSFKKIPKGLGFIVEKPRKRHTSALGEHFMWLEIILDQNLRYFVRNTDRLVKNMRTVRLLKIVRAVRKVVRTER